MYVAPQRFLRRQPTVIAEAQRVKNKENLQVEKLVKLPTSVGSKRALKKWTIGWMLVILVQSAFCLNPFITPVVAEELVEFRTSDVKIFIAGGVVISFIGMGAFITVLCVQDNTTTPAEAALWTSGYSAFAVIIILLLVLCVFLRIFDVNAVGATRDTDSGKSRSRRRQALDEPLVKSSGGS
eukprot:GHVQ01039215.1.p1 GENE.GHVQ01039215.1~~GHVQ01039215.1.p1  ORF type:complete len:182 (+),score=14.65 GHVQ01039215.1:1-546(+)